MVRFPNGVCNLPDPADLGPNCVPKLNLNIIVRNEQNIVKQNVTLRAVCNLSNVVKAYGIDFKAPPGFYDEILGTFSQPWLFYLEIGPGMSTLSETWGGLDVNWI